jgi:hypothetical protein
MRALCFSEVVLSKKIDYSKYSLKELYEALDSIDSEKFPENYRQLKDELSKPERSNDEVLSELEAEMGNQESDFKSYFIIAVGAFFVLWGFLAEEKGIIHKHRSKEVLVTLADNPDKFYFHVYLAAGIGICSVIFGVYLLVRNSKT